MKTLNSIVLILVAGVSAAQTIIDKTLPVQKGHTIRMHFDYPELVRVSTWDRNEVSIKGTVSINGGENDDAFELKTSTEGGTVSIRNEIRDLKNLPHRITIWEDGRKIVFRDKSEWKKYQEEHGKNYNMRSAGVDMDIVLEIKVPQNAETRVESVYGMVEVRNFSGPILVEATYGGVDAALIEKNVGELVAETNYGNIYTNLDLKIDQDNVRDEDFHMLVSAKPGTGPKMRFESQYGNVYLRKQN